MTEINVNPPPSPPPDRNGPRRGADPPIVCGEPTDRAVLSQPRVAGVKGVEQGAAPEDHVFELTDATVDDFLKNATTPVFLEFYNPT